MSADFAETAIIMFYLMLVAIIITAGFVAAKHRVGARIAGVVAALALLGVFVFWLLAVWT